MQRAPNVITYISNKGHRPHVFKGNPYVRERNTKKNTQAVCGQLQIHTHLFCVRKVVAARDGDREGGENVTSHTHTLTKTTSRTTKNRAKHTQEEGCFFGALSCRRDDGFSMWR